MKYLSLILLALISAGCLHNSNADTEPMTPTLTENQVDTMSMFIILTNKDHEPYEYQSPEWFSITSGNPSPLNLLAYAMIAADYHSSDEGCFYALEQLALLSPKYPQCKPLAREYYRKDLALKDSRCLKYSAFVSH